MRKLIVIIPLLFFQTLLFSYNLSIYDGIYRGDEKQHVRYQYYENENNERIYHGFFKMNGKNNFGNNYTINGQFCEGLRNGVWTIMSNFGDVTSETTAEYLNGKLDGKCKTRGIDSKTKKVVLLSTATFNNNLLTGKYSYIQYDKNQNPVVDINVNFDSDGLYDGEYMVRFIDNHIHYEDKRNYKNGILISQFFRDVDNGDIIVKHDEKVNINNFDRTSFTKEHDYWTISLFNGFEYWIPQEHGVWYYSNICTIYYFYDYGINKDGLESKHEKLNKEE